MDIKYLLFLQKIRESMGIFGEPLFSGISDLASDIFVLVVISITYWSINKKKGAEIAINLAIACFASQILKNTFTVYRPWMKDRRIHPSSKAIKGATGYSFPSGHSQNAVSTYGVLALNSKKKWIKIILFCSVALIAFSRNFLGVHTPQDVIVGLLVGCITIIVVKKLINWVETSDNKSSNLIFLLSVFAIVAVSLIYMNLKSYPIDYYEGSLIIDSSARIAKSYEIAGITIGILLGWILERRYIHFTTNIQLKTRILRALIGTALAIIIAYLTKQLISFVDIRLASFLYTFSILFFVSFLWPAIFTNVENMKNKKLIRRIAITLVSVVPFLIIGTRYDLDITYKLSAIKYIDGVYIFNIRPLSLVIELLSEWPTAILLGVLMYIIKENVINIVKDNKKAFLINSVYILLIMAGGMREWYSCFSDVLGDGKLNLIHYLFAFILTLITVTIGLHFFKKIKKETIRKYYKQSVLIFCAGAVIFFVFAVLKIVWGRIRLQDLVALGNLDNFTPWYKPNLFSGGMSFPSGHVAKASVLYLLIICFEGNEFKKQRNLIICGVTVWLILVCVNRLFTASHYLTDIVVGTGLALLAVFVFLEIWEYLKTHDIFKY